MTKIDEICQWVLTYPGFGEGSLTVEYLDSQPGSNGLYTNGVRELERYTNILGDTMVREEWGFTLRRVVSGQGDTPENAGWLEEFAHWVKLQSIYGKAPQFGNLPGFEKMRAQGGKLYKSNQTGTCTYTIDLIVDCRSMYRAQQEI